jgi:Zn-dependent protease
MDGVDWGQVALLVAIVVPSVILHEVAHGAVALRLGDDTARKAGRLTLNPLAHVDPFGTVLLPVLLAASGFGVIGYAKPVPVNLRKLRRPRDHAVVVALAGPATNLAIAVLAAVAVRISGGVGTFGDGFDDGHLSGVDVVDVIYLAGFFNVLLALFNLLPIPPLDGSAVIERAIPRRWWPMWARLRRWSIGIVLVAVLLFGAGGAVVEPAFAIWEAMI